MDTRGSRLRWLLAVLLVSATLLPGAAGPVSGRVGSQVSPERPFAQLLTSASQAIDAVPTRHGGGFYYLAIDDRGPGVFRVSGQGGAPQDVLIGDPLRTPTSLVLSVDNERLFVADSTAGEGGGVLVVDAHGGGVLSSFAAGHQPQGIDLLSPTDDGANALVYYTGIDLADGQPAVFRARADGADTVVLAKGALLARPSGIAVSRTGEVYVADTPATPGAGRIIKLVGPAMVEVAGGLWLGSPAGIALTLDEQALAISGLTPSSGGATVYLLELATGALRARDDGIGQSTAAGGVHRAGNRNLFGWADSTVGGRGGAIYRIDPAAP